MDATAAGGLRRSRGDRRSCGSTLLAATNPLLRSSCNILFGAAAAATLLWLVDVDDDTAMTLLLCMRLCAATA